MKRNSHGLALPLVLLILLCLAVFGHGALLLARRELRATWDFRDLVRAEEAAEIGLHLSSRSAVDPLAPRPLWEGQPILSGRTSDGLRYSVVRRWLDGEFFLLEGRGRVEGWEGQRTTVWVGWTLHPGVRMRSFLGAVEVGLEVVQEGEGLSEASGFLSPPDGWPTDVCPDYRPAMDSVPAITASGPVVVGDPLGGPRENGDIRIPPLGLLEGTALLQRAEGWKGEENLSGPGGWKGCPGQDPHPVLLGSEGDLTLTGDSICGVLVVGGNLLLKEGAVFRGLALVAGDLILESQGTMEGMGRVGRRLMVGTKGEFRGRGCPAAWAMTETKELHTPVLVRGKTGPAGS